MKKISVIFLIIGVLAVSAFVWVNYTLETPGFQPPQPKDSTVRTKAPESFLDLKPKLVEKLQQLVKTGSNGLYNLYIRELDPDILQSTIRISGASLVPDTNVLNQLKAANRLPSEVFRIRADSILIDGLGLKDILSGHVIDVKSILIRKPIIETFPGSAQSSDKEDSVSLYRRLMKQMTHIGIGKILIQQGSFIAHHEGSKPTAFHQIGLALTDIRIDSTTERARDRFLFAKSAKLTLRDYSSTTADQLYTLRVGLISVEATRKLLVASNITLQPRYNKAEFQHHTNVQKERYEFSVPTLRLNDADWWGLCNQGLLSARSAEISRADIHIYLDRRKPEVPSDRRGFPDQLLMRVPLKINIPKVSVHDLHLTYEEFSKMSGETGQFSINDFHGTISNVTNMPQAIQRNNTATVVSSGNFMNIAPFRLTLHFDLSRARTGVFSAELESDKPVDATEVNPVAEPLGLFMIKRGKLDQLVSRIKGDNRGASGEVTALYHDLHITPLKKDDRKGEGLKKKSFTSLIANAFVLKDANPSKSGEPRKESASFTRQSGTFFNLIWKTTLVGILKTIGAPEKLASE